MNLHQEFHEHLQAGRISAAISLVVSKLVELKITTTADSGSLNTTVDLLSGQITSTVDSAFINNKAEQKLLEFHTNQIAATSQVVREQLRSLQDLLQFLPTTGLTVLTTAVESVDVKPASEITSQPNPQPEFDVAQLDNQNIANNQAAVASPQITNSTVPEILPPQIAKQTEPPNTSNSPVDPPPQSSNDSVAIEPVVPAIEKSAATFTKPESRSEIARGLAAALAQTQACDPSEAATIPNKFDQALKSAGVQSGNEDLHPFTPLNPLIANRAVSPSLEQPTHDIQDQELIGLLSDSNEDWDEWLLEEDNILSELSDITKDQMPDLEASWLAETTNRVSTSERSPAEWDEFMPECADLNTITSKNQANVERFRQNLVNDPQLMSELLAELDDLEQLDEGKSKP